MKIRLKPQWLPFSGKLTTVVLVLALSALSVMTAIVSWVAFVSMKTLALGLFVIGFRTLYALSFAFALTAIAFYAAWLCFSVTRDVWTTFNLRRTAAKASAGS